MKKLWSFFFFVIPLLADVKICLVSVLENEDQAIRECLTSAKECIDAVCIVDAAPSGRTNETVYEILEAAGIPGVVYPCGEKIDNLRTFAIRTAQTMLKEMKISLESAYFLLLDPDMVLQVGKGFDKSQLRKDAYLLLQKSSALSYCTYRPRLLRASLDWNCDHFLHEAWVLNKPFEAEKLRNLALEGGNALNKTSLLEEALKKKPDRRSYLLQLAQSYKGAKRYEAAIDQYQKRIKEGGDLEEIWFSKYMVGSCYEELKEWDKALYWYLEAFQDLPDRPDTLLKIATHYRLFGQNDLALIFAKYGSLIGRPFDQNLFGYPPLKDFQFEEEISIAAYYTRFQKEGFDAASDLALRKNIPWWIRDQNNRNILFYIKGLKNARFQPIEPSLPKIEEEFEERYHPMNPSILKTKDGYWVNCRAVNYTQTGAKIFNTIDSQGMFRTKNFLMRYTSEFVPVWEKEIIEDLPRDRIRALCVEGLEDCRIFNYENELWSTCTTFDTNPTGQPQISLCKWLPECCEKIVPIESLTPLIGPDSSRCEKNWLPFVKDGRLQVIYSYDPLILLAPDPKTGKCETVLNTAGELDLSRLRGSAGPIPFEGGYLVLVHEVLLFPDFSRCYIHRFLSYDSEFVLKRISNPFLFQHQGVEYCCSMTWNHAESELVMAVGIEDREAYLCFVDLETIRSLLHSLPLVQPDLFP